MHFAILLSLFSFFSIFIIFITRLFNLRKIMELTYKSNRDSQDSAFTYQPDDKVSLLFSLNAAQTLGYLSLKLFDGTVFNYTAMALYQQEERLYFWEDAIITGICRFGDIASTSSLQKLPRLKPASAVGLLNTSMLENMAQATFKDTEASDINNRVYSRQLELVWGEHSAVGF
jgi:hypothetical protein